MLSHKKDTDYLALSAWTRAKENELLTRERLDRMIEAKELGEAVKVLTQCGYSEPESLTQAGLEAMLAQERQRTFQELGGSVPDPRVVQIFQLKYDYHNAKTLIKGRAMGAYGGRAVRPGAAGGELRAGDVGRDHPGLCGGGASGEAAAGRHRRPPAV